MTPTSSTPSSNPARTLSADQRAVWCPKTRRAQITFPFAPMSVNSMYRTVTRGGKSWITISARGKVWKADAMEILTPLQAHYPLEQRVNVEINFWYFTKLEIDVDNTLKPLLDVLQQVPPESIVDGTPEWFNKPILENDKQIRSLTVTRMPFDPKKKNGETWIDIWPAR